MIRAALALALSALTISPACAQAETDPRQWTLPNGLSEISGLAVASNGALYAHNDEFAIIYEIDPETGDVGSAFALGDPTTRGDFEGAAVRGDRIYLITSAGLIYEAPLAEHGERVRFNVFDTGAGEACEIEGLTVGAADGEFFILCKRALRERLKNRLVIFSWSLHERREVGEPFINIGHTEFLTTAEQRDFRAAGIEWDAGGEVLSVVSARSHLIAQFRLDGELVGKSQLPASAHRQSEGIARLPSGAFAIADEAGGRTPATLTVYERLP